MNGVPYSFASVWVLCFHSVSENNGAETGPHENDSYIYPAFYHIDTRHIPQQRFCHSWHTYQWHRLVFSNLEKKREETQYNWKQLHYRGRERWRAEAWGSDVDFNKRERKVFNCAPADKQWLKSVPKSCVCRRSQTCFSVFIGLMVSLGSRWENDAISTWNSRCSNFETLFWPEKIWGRQQKKADHQKTNDGMSEHSCDPWTLNCLTLSYSPHLNYHSKLHMIEWVKLTNKQKKSFLFYSALSLHFLPIIFTRSRLDWKRCVWSSPAEGWGSCSEVA